MTIRTIAIPVLLCAMVCFTGHAQTTTPEPATDSSTQASPIQPAPPVPAVDASTEASPTTATHIHHGPVLPGHTAIHLALGRSIDSGRLKNGDSIPAHLRSPIILHGVHIPAGTHVELTVISTVPAGKISSAGEFSLEAVRVGNTHVFTDVQTFRGRPGHKDTADSAPAVGTDAGLRAGAALTFHVLPMPTAETALPSGSARTPGSVTATASGGPPPTSAAHAPSTGSAHTTGSTHHGGTNSAGRQSQRSVTPADTTSHPIHGSSPSPASAPQPQ